MAKVASKSAQGRLAAPCGARAAQVPTRNTPTTFFRLDLRVHAFQTSKEVHHADISLESLTRTQTANV